MGPQAKFNLLLKQSRFIREQLPLILKAASSDSLILISGEEGTEKELIARMIHLLGMRSRRPFTRFDCSDARQRFFNALIGGEERRNEPGDRVLHHPGLLEATDGGTLFLNEIERLEIRDQVFLKTLIENSGFFSEGTMPAGNVRFIFGGRDDLEQRIEEGRFYRGLYYTIAVLEITIPPLRYRKEDIIALSRFILGNRTEKTPSGKPLSLSLDAVAPLISYDWPGNFDELKRTLYRAAERVEGTKIRSDDLPESVRFPRYRERSFSGTAGRPLS